MFHLGATINYYLNHCLSIRQYCTSAIIQKIRNLLYVDDLSKVELNPNVDDKNENFGILWDAQKDKLIFVIGYLLNRMNHEDMTKRLFLHFTASNFDRMGIFSPVLMPLEAIF